MGIAKVFVKTRTVLIIEALLFPYAPSIQNHSADAKLTLGDNQNWLLPRPVVLSGNANNLVRQYQVSLDQISSEFGSGRADTSQKILPQKPNETNINHRKLISEANIVGLNQIDSYPISTSSLLVRSGE